MVFFYNPFNENIQTRFNTGTKQALQELEAKHTATELKLRRLMHKTGKSARPENQDLNVTLKTMKAELERVEERVHV